MSRSPSSQVLTETKLHPPVVRGDWIPRTGLLERLTEGALPRLTLVDAPPGSGKTNLLAQWCAVDARRRFGWLSVDPTDNDPVRFWTYLLRALRVAAPDLAATADSFGRLSTETLFDIALPRLINDLATTSGEHVVIVDDYHAISNAEIHDAMAFLVERAPPQARLVLAARSDPPLPLARLRVADELLEIRARELRFNRQEATSLLNGALGLDLPDDEIVQLLRRTEGWAAGLYLAALSLRGVADPDRAIRAFAGDDRHLVDYLGGEVLAGQTEEVRSFLLRTSILDRFTAPMCDAVLEGTGSQAMLDRIEHANLFLVGLDEKRRWYRYHHLFQELLRYELDRREPGLAETLHRRASQWHRAAGLISEAVAHACAAGDHADAAGLIGRHWLDHFNQGQLATVSRWLDALPPEIVQADPRLCVARAWLAMDAARVADAEEWIAVAEAHAASDAEPSGRPVGSETAVLKAVLRFKVGNAIDAHDAARRALALDRSGDPFIGTVGNLMLGATSFWMGTTSVAEAALENAAALSRASGNDLGLCYALGYLALIRADVGDAEHAQRLAREALALSDDPGFTEHFVTMIAHCAAGRSLEVRGRLPEAADAFARAVDLSRRGAGALEVALGLLLLARARHGLGDVEAATEAFEEGRKTLEACPEPGIGRNLLKGIRRLLQVGAGGRRSAEVAASEALTERELAVLRLLGGSLSQREIAGALYVSMNTVKTHIRGIYRKLDASTRTQAVSRARQLGLI